MIDYIKKKFTTILRFSLLLLIYSCSEQNSTFANAKKLIEEKDYNGAIDVLTKIIEKQPSFDSAYIQRAYAYMMIGEVKNSFNDYDKAMSNPSFKISALDGRACLHYNIGDYEKAVEDYSKIIKLDKNNYQAYCNRGIAKTQLRIYGSNPDNPSLSSMDEDNRMFYFDYNGILRDFNKAIEINSKYGISYVNRGDLFMQLHDTSKALEDYHKAIKVDSNYFDAYLKRALLYKDLGDSKKALADFDKSIQLNPTSPFPFVNRGYLKKESLNDKEGACMDFRKAEELGLKMEDEDKKYCN